MRVQIPLPAPYVRLYVGLYQNLISFVTQVRFLYLTLIKYLLILCGYGGIGIHSRLRIYRFKHEGSTPSIRTLYQCVYWLTSESHKFYNKGLILFIDSLKL